MTMARPALPTSKVEVAVKVTGFPGATSVESDAREIPSQVTLTSLEASPAPGAGGAAPGRVMNAAKLWRPGVAAYATRDWLDGEHAPASACVVVYEIRIALR